VTIVRDLTDKEREHAIFLARQWHKLTRGNSPFANDCESLAQKGWISRSQYETLKKGPRLIEKPPHLSLNIGGRSKRPITLASKA